VNVQQLKKIAAFYARFTLSFSQVGYRARSLTWPATPLDFSGQHWVITGASGGIGRQIALSAGGAGASVCAIARSQAKLERLAADAGTIGIRRLDTMICDFSLQADTAALVAKLLASGRRIDVLVNNVGVLNDDHSLTTEGRERSFAVNLLSHYLLTEALIRGGGFGDRRPLVINMTSGGAYNLPLDTSMLNVVDPARYNGTAAYGFHKRAQMVLNQHWRSRYGPRGFTFYVMHPGWADTDGVKRSLPRFRRILKSILRDAKSGADTALWLAATRPPQPEEESVWFDRKIRPAHVYPRTRLSKDDARSLVAWLDQEVARVPVGLP